MKQIGQLLSDITTAFYERQFCNPKRQAEDLLSDLLSCSRNELYSNSHRQLSEQEWQTAQDWLQQRLQGKPLAYLSGKVEFYGCSIEVNPSVLIPRQETEVLVDKIVTSLKQQDLKGKKLWDLCCGSGCIGIALKKVLPSLSICLSDTSGEAIALAEGNAAINQVDVACLKGDLLTPFQGEKAHYIVCNPPYISEKEYLELDREVKEYEPRLALVAGESGLEFYERLAQELPHYLHSHGQVWLEMGYQQGFAIEKLFQAPPWKARLLENDWAGHHRFFFLEIE